MVNVTYTFKHGTEKREGGGVEGGKLGPMVPPLLLLLCSVAIEPRKRWGAVWSAAGVGACKAEGTPGRLAIAWRPGMPRAFGWRTGGGDSAGPEVMYVSVPGFVREGKPGRRGKNTTPVAAAETHHPALLAGNGRRSRKRPRNNGPPVKVEGG